MKMAIRILFTTYCFLGLVLPTLAAPSVAQDDTLWIEGSVTSIDILFSDLTSNDVAVGQGFINIERQPTFGTLDFALGRLIYTPTAGFRDFGYDSFTYFLRSKSGVSELATVHLYMQIPSVLVLSQGFEPGEPINFSVPYSSGPTSPVDFGIQGALDGTRGVHIELPAGQTQGHYLAFPVDFADNNDDGRTTLLGCGDGGIVNGAAVITLSNIGDDVNTSPVRVFFTEDPNGDLALVAEVRNADETGYTSSPLLPYNSDVLDLSLQWSPDGVILGANGITVTHSTPVTIDDGPFEVRIGIMPFSSLDEPASFDFDRHRVYKKAAIPPPFPGIFHDRFEDPLETWTDSYGSGLNGMGWGTGFWYLIAKDHLRVSLGVGSSFLVDGTPDMEELFHGRFTLEVADLPSLPTPLEIYELGNTADPIFDENPHVSVRLRSFLTTPQISLVVRTPTGETASPWVSLTGQHEISLKYRVAASDFLPVGYAHLWIDDQPAASLINVANQGAETDWVRLGGMSVDPAAVGVLIFEDYESWR